MDIIIDKIENDVRLDKDDALKLYHDGDFLTLGDLADKKEESCILLLRLHMLSIEILIIQMSVCQNAFFVHFTAQRVTRTDTSFQKMY